MNTKVQNDVQQDNLVSRFSYLNQKLEIKGTADIKKLTAASKIERGETVAVWGGKPVHRNDLSTMNAKGYALQIDKDFYMVNPASDDVDSIQLITLNNSPNCAFNGQITLQALRDIQAGEEISFDPFGERIKSIEKFENGAWGLLTSLDVEDCDPDIIRDADAIKRYVVELCDLIDMKRFGDTHVVFFGEDDRVAGYSMFQLIETSCISGHFANVNNRSYIDVFSCKGYEPEVVKEFTQRFFKGGTTRITVSNRY